MAKLFFLWILPTLLALYTYYLLCFKTYRREHTQIKGYMLETETIPENKFQLPIICHLLLIIVSFLPTLNYGFVVTGLFLAATNYNDYVIKSWLFKLK